VTQLDTQYYFVRSPTGYLSLGQLNATPKLYTLGGAKAVARRRSKPRRVLSGTPGNYKWIDGPPQPAWEVVPVSLTVGDPISF
jgi:hypothetical protein